MASVFQRVPPLHLLIAFESAARLGSFARAAEELSVTPSAVSHRIKNLEELWGEDLFVRSNAALRLTAAGTRYQRNVQDALKSLNELARPEYNKLRTRLRDRFKLATTVGYGPRFLHSTGQLHKGDAGHGLFIQFTDDALRLAAAALTANHPKVGNLSLDH